MNVKNLILLTISILLSSNIAASDWKLIKNKDDIKVYERSISTSKIKEFKATVRLQTSLASIIAVFDDEKAYPSWVYDCSSAKIIDDSSFSTRISTEEFDLPFPVKNRVIISQSHMTQNPQTQTITISMKAIPNYCQNRHSEICKQIKSSSAVMVPKSTGFYKLTTVDNGKAVDITWQQHAESGGLIPKVLINALIADIPYYSLRALRERVKIPVYNNAKFTYNNAKMITGFTPETKKW